MTCRKVAWAWAVWVLVLGAAPMARSAEMRFDVLRQSSWQPFFHITPPSGLDWSVKVFDEPSGALHSEWRPSYGFNTSTENFGTFEALRASTYRVEYRPAGASEASVYRLTLDAPTWSSALLPAPRPTVVGEPKAGESVTVNWPVHEGAGSAYVRVMGSNPPRPLYDKSVAYNLGEIVTDPLPAGFGYAEVDYVRDLAGAFARMELMSGPATDMALSTGVQYVSWQGTGFAVVPEPGALVWLAVGGAAMLRRR